MTWEIAFMLGLLVVMLAAFVWERVPTELTAMSAFALLLVLGLLPSKEAMEVFSNTGPLAVGAMFILSAALEKCGAIDRVAAALVRLPAMQLWMVMPILLLGVGLISAFINNTPVVVVFLPVVLSLARRMRVSPSKLLIPLSYGAIFGGTCTLVGTSTNIIVSSIAGAAGYEPFSMFELAVVGIPIFLAGILYLSLFGNKLLPDRATISSILTEEERREYIVEAYVKDDSDLVGKSLADTRLGSVSSVRILEVLRHGVRIQDASGGFQLESGDRLLLALSPRAVSHAQEEQGLEIRDSLGEGLGQISLSTGIIVEAVLGPDSSLVGKALGDINFRQQYRLAPMAIHRRGKNLMRDFDRIELEYGDTLLLLGTTEAVDQLRSHPDLLILDRPPVVLASRRKRIPLILATIAGVVGVATLGIMPIAPAAMIGCVFLLLTRCLSTREAYDSIHWPIMFLIFAMLGVGAAMEATGTTSWLATKLVHVCGTFVTEQWRAIALLAGIYLITTTLTEVLSNNAAAVLLSTLAIGVAQSLGLDPRPFLIAIAVAASASFATPIGYQTNTYVYGVGGYRFSDFARIGIPLNILAFIVSMIVIPLVWEF